MRGVLWEGPWHDSRFWGILLAGDVAVDIAQHFSHNQGKDLETDGSEN